jgi:hypothetical protein
MAMRSIRSYRFCKPLPLVIRRGGRYLSRLRREEFKTDLYEQKVLLKVMNLIVGV